MEFTSDFFHRALADASKQIRLLRHVGQRNDGILCFTLSDWLLTEAPIFNAISYEWGLDPDLCVILINGRRKRVRWNCHHALWQCTLHYSAEYLWIDSVAIDQDSLDEKSVQVQFMVDIYKRAKRVLACVGPHADESERLFRLAIEASQRRSQITTRSQNAVDSLYYKLLTHWKAWLLETAELWLLQAVNEFAARTYWSRLWIVPEIMNARKVKLLCGSSNLARETFADLFNELRLVPAGQQLNRTQYAIVQGIRNTRAWPLKEILEKFNSFRCADPRDRIYAFAKNTAWWIYELPPIQPDYTINTFQLACSLYGYCLAEDTYSIARSLDINKYTERVRTSVSNRRSEHMTLTKTLQPDTKSTRHPLKWTYQVHYNTLVRVFVDNNWNLSVPVRTMRKGESTLPEDPLLFRWERDRISPHRIRQQPQPLMNGSRVVALACPEIQAGDFIFPIDHDDMPWQPSNICLILRPFCSNTYNIIGQATLLKDYTVAKAEAAGQLEAFGAPSSVQNSVSMTIKAAASTTLSPEDLVVLVAQDCLHDGEIDQEERYLRTNTRPTTYPLEATIILDQSWSDAESIRFYN